MDLGTLMHLAELVFDLQMQWMILVKVYLVKGLLHWLMREWLEVGSGRRIESIEGAMTLQA
jgi:hypothetical protein